MPVEDNAEALTVLRAVLALGRQLRAQRRDGRVTLAGLSVLGALSRTGPRLAAELAVAERLQPQSLTRIIASLDRDGLIERQPSETDGRALRIALTDKGRALLAEDLRARQAWLERAMEASLTAEERETLTTAAQVMMKLAFSAARKNP